MGMMNYSVGKMGLGQAEQNCILCVHMFSCLYCTVQLPDASLASVLSTNHRRALSYLLCSDWSNRLLTVHAGYIPVDAGYISVHEGYISVHAC